MFKKWRLRRLSVRLLGLSADFERAQTELEDREDAAGAAYALKQSIGSAQEVLLTLQDVARESEDEDELDFVDSELRDTESFAQEAEHLANEISEVNPYAGADLLEQLADIYETMAMIREILADKYEEL